MYTPYDIDRALGDFRRSDGKLTLFLQKRTPVFNFAAASAECTTKP